VHFFRQLERASSRRNLTSDFFRLFKASGCSDLLLHCDRRIPGILEVSWD
jgi:hypothetical protein